MATTKGQTIANYAISKIGCAYIYGGYGEKKCTPEFRKERAKAYLGQKNNIYNNCPVLSGKKDTCEGCKWNGKQAYDCAQLTRYSCKAAGQALVSGANSQWNKTEWDQKGKIDTLPDASGVLLYHANSNGTMTHTGVYIGGGYVVEARGAKAGVIKSALADYKWTHWAALPGVLSGKTVRPAEEGRPTLRKGARGTNVTELQKLLIERGYALPRYGADGHFGEETDKAVRSFQSLNGLDVDGIVGPQTWAALEKKTVKYTVHITGLSESVANALIAQYGGKKEVDSVGA